MIKTLRYDVDEEYLSTLGIKLLQGRNFSKDYATDSSAIVLNETAARVLGWSNNALGHELTHTDNHGQNKLPCYRRGEDFNFRSLHESISPLVMTWHQTPPA